MKQIKLLTCKVNTFVTKLMKTLTLQSLDDLGEVRICPENVNTKSINNNLSKFKQQEPLR